MLDITALEEPKTVLTQQHCPSPPLPSPTQGNLFEAFQLSAAKKPAAAEVSWITVSKNLSLCGHQSKFLHAAADKLHAYW